MLSGGEAVVISPPLSVTIYPFLFHFIKQGWGGDQLSPVRNKGARVLQTIWERLL